VKNLRIPNRQFLLYCIIGAGGVSLDFTLYTLLVKTGVPYQPANAIGYASGTLLSFMLNAWINFRVTDHLGRRLASFFSVAFLGWLASALLLQLLIGRLDLDKFFSKFVTLVIVLLLQYNLNRRISFRKTT
jgi:putative flippase GtrA